MDRLVKKYAAKLISAGLASSRKEHLPLVGGLDDELIWNRPGPETQILEAVFDGLHINSLVFLRPQEPYRTMIGYLAGNADRRILPTDCETRTFLHELPVTDDFSAAAIIGALKHHKCVILTSVGEGTDAAPVVIAHGTVSPEQGFVVVSSVCFACYVKFMTDYLQALQSGTATAEDHAAFDRAAKLAGRVYGDIPSLLTAPFADEETVYRAIAQAGRKTVEHHLVDSYFGNISYRWRDTLYISQTGSSLDELEGCVDPVPLDGSSSAGLTASSELSAHLDVIARTSCRAILHGHPKYAVILSMDCPPEEKSRCRFVDQCHIRCPKPRFVEDVPIVPGEVGTGPTGLCHTLPPALAQHDRAIVYGHGLFTTARDDFNEAFRAMVAVEKMCCENFFEKVHALRS